MLRTVQSPLFSRKIVENQRYAILTGSSLSYLKGGDGLETPRPAVVHLNPITKWLPVKVSARSRRSCEKKGTVNRLSMLQLIVTYYFITLTKGSCNKTVISLGSVGSADSTASVGFAVPRSGLLDIHKKSLLKLVFS